MVKKGDKQIIFKMNAISVINDSEKIFLTRSPFPHVIIKDALPQELADQLTSEFPIMNFDISSNNKRIDISASKVQKDNNISSLWKEFIDYHSSNDFFREVIELFKPCLSDNEYESYLKFSSGIRGIDSHKEKQVLLDAQISINTPVIKTNSVRKAHVDNTNKLFSGLYYLRSPDDNSIGGDLELLNWKNSYTDKQKIKFYREGVAPKHFSTFKKIRYENNIAILFLNSIDAMHLVSPRHPTTYPRFFVNLVGELNHDIFKKYSYFQENINILKDISKNFRDKLFK
jgi:hypothetical protein